MYQYRKTTTYSSVVCFMDTWYLPMFVGTILKVQECIWAKSPAEKTIAIIYTNRNKIIMICLVGLHVPINNDPT